MSGLISAQVTDELLERIDSVREGEPPDYDESRSATVRRLIRSGLEQTEDESGNELRGRLIDAAGVLLVAGLPTLYASTGQTTFAAVMVALFVGMVLLNPQIDRAIDRLKSLRQT